jgi:uncharacterized protein with HEPN domain
MRDDPLRLKDIVGAAENILKFSRGKTRADLERDVQFQSAVLFQMFVIGEAAKNVSTKITDKYPNLDWRAICGMRDHIGHAYFSLDLDIVWGTVMNRVPELAEKIREILKAEFPEQA